MSHQGNQPLPSKEANLLRQIVKFYEMKQYKKGIRTADQILKDYPEHGETLALKGLTLNCLDKKEEAYNHVTRGLRSDVKSHVCWHVYGLLHRSDRDYKKAISCYTNALKHDKDNLQILRDLALLQIQMRDLGGFLDTRYRLLQLRPGNRNNWVAFAAGHYLNKNYEVAVQVLTTYEGTLEEATKDEAYERSELLMFKCKILEEMEKYDEALGFLSESKSKSLIKDRLGAMEAEARIFTKLKRVEEAQNQYSRLLDLLPENYDYHYGMHRALGFENGTGEGVPQEVLQRLEAFYKAFGERHPRSLSGKRIPLDYLEGEAFLEAAREYVKGYILRGIPSLFSDLKPLYKTPSKAAALQDLFEGYCTALAQSDPETDPELVANPQCLLWIHHFLAQHYDRLGQTDRALDHLQSAIDHTPTVSELYVIRGKILKHAGDMPGPRPRRLFHPWRDICHPGAFEAADWGRKMDLADRYLNCIAVKACFRADRIKEADELAVLFTKDEEQLGNLVEMQCLWYEIACGNAHFRRRNYGKALKKYAAVSKHFDDFVEDQFDFHGYCVRKMTLRAYIDMLHMEDKIYSEQTYARAARGAIRCYLELNDDVELHKRPNTDAATETSKPKKKKETTNAHKKGQPPPQKADPDPDGVELASVKDPLKAATKFVTVLRRSASEQLESQELGFEVYLRKERMLLALSCVQRAIDIAGRSHPTVHSMIIRLCSRGTSLLPLTAQKCDPTVVPVESEGEGEATAARQVLYEGIGELLQGASVSEYHQQYFEREWDASVIHRAVCVELFVNLEPDKRETHLGLLKQDEKLTDSEKPSLKECQQVYALLLGATLKATEVAETWKRRCAEWFPRSSFFGGAIATHLDSVAMSSTNGTEAAMR